MRRRFAIAAVCLMLLSACSGIENAALRLEVARLKGMIANLEEENLRLRNDIESLNIFDDPGDFALAEEWVRDEKFEATVRDGTPLSVGEMNYFLRAAAAHTLIRAKSLAGKTADFAPVVKNPGAHRTKFFTIEGKLIDLEYLPAGDEIKFGPEFYWVATILAGGETGDRIVRLYFLETLENVRPGDRVTTFAVFVKTRKSANRTGEPIEMLVFAGKKLFKTSQIGY